MVGDRRRGGRARRPGRRAHRGLWRRAGGAAYETAIANRAPGLPRRPKPESVDELLEWSNEPLATAEVALIMQRSLDAARRALEPVARFEPAGADGYWTL